MAQINPYLTFNGNCGEAFLFYKSVFGGDFKEFLKFGDMPPMEGQELTESDKQKTMHVSFPISSETILMGSDITSSHPNVVYGQNISLSVNTSTKTEADTLFNGLAVGGNITMPLSDTFWGAYFGMLIDKFGIAWMINCDAK